MTRAANFFEYGNGLALVWSLLISCLVSCASGPDKQDPLTALSQDDASPGTASPGAPAVDEKSSDAERPADGTLPFGGKMSRPYQISGPSPSLPPRAIEKHVKGTFMARCVITETGSVEECKIIKGLPESNAHLLQILKAQKYSPVMYEDKPQRVYYTFKINFR